MWVAVAVTDQLGTRPIRAHYWGSPVVVFRTDDGGVAALADRCAHRGVPLSEGTVRDGTIRCDFHHFRFDATGSCVEVPSEFEVDENFRQRCTVRRYFARESVGLIWVSAEDEPEAPFPVDHRLLPERYVLQTGHFEVAGDLRVWMDHFLDIPHCVWAHAETVYGGSQNAPADLLDHKIDIDTDSTYPVRPAVAMKFGVPDRDPVASYDLLTLAYTTAIRLARRLHLPVKHARPFTQGLEVHLVTPLCQETHGRIGRMSLPFIGWSGLAPIDENRHQFFYSGIVPWNGEGRLRRALFRTAVKHFAERHLGHEDNRFLAAAAYVEGEEFHDTPMDTTVRAMRSLFADYQKRKAHLYSSDSLLPQLDYHDEKTS
ncbi:hypothetical protein BS329_16940 [Amycolatopsis coloradensis]|uniref:Rieske domain-containing protein n=2 Tax=Amycolatopsis coloradensis TaxID=76021 RepID=A0A1R0KTW5_9PSEU|nr:hypothetical protein BS329_16940 [Amycolatopsis coloradensis]